VEEFAFLFEDVGEPFAEEARLKIEQATGVQNPSEVPQRRPSMVRLDNGANLDNWRRRLSPAEVEPILDLVGPVADRFYPDWTAVGYPERS
jgi:hypothetical protein